MATARTEAPDIPMLWIHQLQQGKGGDPLGNIRNVITALEQSPELNGLIGLNSFDQRVWQLKEAPWDKSFERRPWKDVYDTELQVFLQSQNIPIGSGETVHRAVNTVASRHQYHPIRDYFDAIEWDGMERIGRWLADFLGVANNEYTQSIGRKFLIGTIARVYEPGCKMDTMLVLEGPQGIRKSETVNVLGHPWVSESLPDVGTKDAMQQLQGAWIIEIAELSAVRHKEVETVKSFISRRVDRFRPPYHRRPDDFPRQCVFIGTTNEDRYLLDTTGNRRFWPVVVTDVDTDALAAVRDQLMVEALHYYREGEPWHFTDDDEIRRAREEQELRRVRHPWEDSIVPILERIESSNENPSVTAKALLEELDIPVSKQTAWDSRRIAEIVRAQGWVSSTQGHKKLVTFTKPKVRGHADA